MPFVSKIEARAYARATEVVDRVIASVLNLFPESLRSKVIVRETKGDGQAGDIIIVVSMTLDGQEDCESVLDYILEKMDRQSHRIIERTLEIRLDDQCTFFLRIDKQLAFLGKLKMADGPDVISLKFHFRQYPRCKREEVQILLKKRLRTDGGGT